MLGIVSNFDDGRGLGTVVAEGAEGAEFPFHCTRIAGRARTIAVGTLVEFDVAAGLAGRWEAVNLHPVENL